MIESVIGAAAQAIKPLNQGVPGVPLHSLDAISDENTRQVLRAIVDGWHMRNGASGDGDNRFVTAREISAVSGRMNSIASAVAQTQSEIAKIPALTPGTINKVINDLQAQVIESQLFKALEERVDLIDKPGGIFERLGKAEITLIDETKARVSGDQGLATRIDTLGLRVGKAETVISTEITQRIAGDTALTQSISVIGARVGDAETGLKNETTQRVNADNALQTTINTQYASLNTSLSLVQTRTETNANNVAALTTQFNQVQASVGNLSTAIATETQARVNADGTLYGQYTVKIDQNGYVSGFGLASTSNNSVPFSEFLVRADRFAIASPNAARVVPFIVQNGVTYIDTVLIKDASITSAKIGDAQVDTLTIAGNAVTVPAVVTGGTPIVINKVPTAQALTTWQTILTLTVDFGLIPPTRVLIGGNANIIAQSGVRYTATRMRMRSLTTGEATSDVGFAHADSIVLTNLNMLINSAPGFNTFVMEISQEDTGGSTYSVFSRSLSVIGAKR